MQTYIFALADISGVSWCKVTEQATAGSSEQAVEHFSSADPPSSTIYGLEVERLIQVQSADNCSALPVQYITEQPTSTRVSTPTTPII